MLFRHIKNSVLRAPYQALILLLTVFFSAIIFVSVSEVQFSVREERNATAFLKYGNAQIVLEPGAESASRYLAVSDVELSEGALVSGYFALPVEAYGETALGGATDFATVGNVFEFSFTAYQEVGEGEAGNALFITEEFAKAHALALGDEVELKLLGVPKVYRVCGINRYDFFGRYELLVQAEGALGVLSTVSPVFAAFDGENFPCNYVYIRLAEGQSVAENLARLNAGLSAYGWTANECADGLEEYAWKTSNFMIVLLLILSMLIAWVLVGFSLRILGEKREEEMRVFWLSGISQNKIFLAFCIEIFLYLAVGTAGGIAASTLFLRLLNNQGLRYALLRLTWRGACIAVLSELAVGGLALTSYRLSLAAVRKPRNTRSGKWLIGCLVGLLVSLVGCLALPVRWRLAFALAALAFALLALLLSASPFCKGVSKGLGARFDKRGRGSPHLVLAAKNCANMREVHNIYRIVNIVLSLAIVLAAGFGYFNNQLNSAREYFQCDYLVLNAGESVATVVEQVEGVEGASAGFVGKAEFLSGESIALIDVAPSYFNGKGDMPTGDGICLPKATARLHGLRVGDRLTLRLFGEEYAFTLTGYSGKASFYAYINAEYYGFRRNTIFVKANDGEETLAALTQEVSSYGAIVGEPQSLLETRIRVAESFNRLMGSYLGLVFTLSAIGCINLVWVCYARRKKQFADLIMVGMTKGEVAKMIAMEGAVLLLSVIAVSAVCGGLLCIALDGGMQAFGFSLFA